MKYDIIILLCPERKNPEDGKFPDYIDGVYLGGQVRMDAAVSIYKENKEAEFIIVGGYDKDGEGSQKIEDMYKFLDDECKNIKITKRPSLPCTFHNLVAILNIWREYDIEVKDKKIGLLTNSYHLPRSLKFWDELVCREEFKKLSIPRPISINAESVVNKSILEKLQETREYLLRINCEKQGLKEIEEKKYKDNCLNKNFCYFKTITKKFPNILLTLEERKIFGF